MSSSWEVLYQWCLDFFLKKEVHYKQMLESLGRAVVEPKYVIVDFEVAAIKAYRAIYPNAQLHGCYFHLSQSITFLLFLDLILV